MIHIDTRIIRGYDKNSPQIKYYQYVQQADDPVINVGGVSSSFVNWGENQRYHIGQYVKYANEFYAVEKEPRAVGGPEDADLEFDGENFVRSVDDLQSDTSKLKEVAEDSSPLSMLVGLVGLPSLMYGRSN